MGGDVGVVKVVEILKNDTSGLGFSVLGGAGSHLPPIVYDILDGSPAALSGELETGDIILEVNGDGVSNLSTKELLKCLRLAKGSVLLTLKRDEEIAQRVSEYLSSPNTLDSLRSAITDRDLSHVRDVIAVRSTPSSAPSSGSAARNRNNGCQSNGRSTRQPTMTVPVAHSPPERRPRPSPLAPPTAHRRPQPSPLAPPTADDIPHPSPLAPPTTDNGHTHWPLTTPTIDEHAHRSMATPTAANTSVTGVSDRPRYEAFTMTGDVMLCLSRRPVHAADLPGAIPHATRAESPTTRSRSPSAAPLASHCNGKPAVSTTADMNGVIRQNGVSSVGISDVDAGSGDKVCTGESLSSDRCLSAHSSPPPSPAPPSPACRSSRHLAAESVSEQAQSTDSTEYLADHLSDQVTAFENPDDQVDAELRPVSSNLSDAWEDCADQQETSPAPDISVTPLVRQQTNDQQAVEESELCELNKSNSEQQDRSDLKEENNEQSERCDLKEITIEQPERATTDEEDDVSVDSDSLSSFTCHLPERAKKAAEAVGASVDVPSAKRLAHRLFALDGFKKRDVSCLLNKNNQFSQVVAAEYSKLFDFRELSLDAALRQFLSHFVLSGETQERERILVHFSQRFVADNPESFRSADACHTLTCALMLLNTDLHGRQVSRKMSCSQFIDNLDGLNDGANFSRDVLKALYKALKNKPLLHSLDDGGSAEAEASRSSDSPKTRSLRRNVSLLKHSLLDSSEADRTVEYKRGYVMRKCCVQPNGRKASVRHRSWRMIYCSLRNLILFIHRDENASRAPNAYSDLSNSISIHHALASKATNYFKKEHVFRLQTADQAEYLIQTSDARELQAWIDAINLSAATHSSPPLPASVNNQKRFQRPLLPAANTTLTMEEQFGHLETRLAQIGGEIVEMDAQPPARGARSQEVTQYRERYTYLKYEIERYRVYLQCLGARLSQLSDPSMTPSTAPTALHGSAAHPPLTAAASALLNGSGTGETIGRQRLATTGHVANDVTISDSPSNQSNESSNTRL